MTEAKSTAAAQPARGDRPSCACPTGATCRGQWSIMDTFETATTWDRSSRPSTRVCAKDVAQAVQQATGHPAFYPAASRTSTRMAPAPHFTIAALGSAQGDVASALAARREIKQAANEAVIKHGGTITHHHAVGATIAQVMSRKHRPFTARCCKQPRPRWTRKASSTGRADRSTDRQVGITGALGRT